LELARQSRALEQSQAQERLLSEPEEHIGGVPVASNFDVTLTGEVDGVAFGPLEGQLLLRRAEVPDEPTVYLQLTTDGPMVPGYSSWITHRDLRREPGVDASAVAKPELQRESGSEDFPKYLPKRFPFPQAPEPGVAVAAKDGCIRITITPAPPFRNVRWHTRNPDHPEDPESTVPVLVEPAPSTFRSRATRFPEA
jgi:hypothetical protein